MKAPRWLTLDIVLALHDESLAEFGGGSGLRDRGLLESALARPQHMHAYEPGSTRADLASAYASGIVRNHPFLDGNKRTGLLALAVFLDRNGIDFEPPEAEEVATILSLAAGHLDDDALAAWVARHAKKRRTRR